MKQKNIKNKQNLVNKKYKNIKFNNMITNNMRKNFWRLKM